MIVTADLIDQLGQAAMEAKGLVRELHGAVKEARSVLKEIAAERGRVETMVHRAVEDEIEERVKVEVTELGVVTKKAMDDSVAKVLKEFAKLETAIFTGGVKRRGAFGDLRDMVG